MTIPTIRGRVARPQKAVIYGPEGVGKSTLASQFPAPVFIDTEGGTHHLDVVRFPEPATWDDVTATIAQLAVGGHEFKTLVIDTADWLEKRLAAHICKKAGKESIEDFGYGKGFTLVAEEFAKFLASLDGLIRQGIHIVFLAHSTVRKFESPDQAGSYDRYELKLSKQTAPLIKEWADLILFANYVTKVAEGDTGRRRGIGGKERVLFTTHAAAYDAKNRHGLEDRLPFAFDSIARVFGAAAAAPAAAPEPAKSVADQLAAVFTGREDAVREFLVSRGQIKAEGTWADIPGDYAKRILSEPERFLQAVEANQQQEAAK
ncbi:MAG: ATP-binding protein [Chthoniobacterales bacterium]|nr:ATP-binding protein [Chthoniobacterales bacterium]